MRPAADFRAAKFRSIRAKNVGIRVKDAKEFRQFCITLREPPAMLQIHHLRIYIFRIVGARGALGDRMIQVSSHLDDSVILKVQQCSASWVTQTSITPPNFIISTPPCLNLTIFPNQRPSIILGREDHTGAGTPSLTAGCTRSKTRLRMIRKCFFAFCQQTEKVYKSERSG